MSKRRKDKLERQSAALSRHPEREATPQILKQMRDFSTSLSLQEEGKTLLKSAIGEHLDKKRGEVVYWMRMIVERVELMNRIITLSEKRLKLCHGQLAAIDKGEFYIDHKNQIVYTNDFLNTPWDVTATW
jgi:hypothetical protein